MKLNFLLLTLSLACFACEPPTEKGKETAKSEKTNEATNKETPKSETPEDIKAEVYKPKTENLSAYKIDGEIVAMFHHTEPAMPDLSTDYVFYKNGSSILRIVQTNGQFKDHPIKTKQTSSSIYRIDFAEEGAFNGEYFILRMPMVLEFYNMEGKRFMEAFPFELPANK